MCENNQGKNPFSIARSPLSDTPMKTLAAGLQIVMKKKSFGRFKFRLPRIENRKDKPTFRRVT